MAKKKIIWSNNAKEEFRNVLEFYTERNGSSTYSLKIIKQTEELLNILKADRF